MRKYFLGFLFILILNAHSIHAQNDNNMLHLSQNFLKALQDKKPTDQYKKQLSDISLNDLAEQLNTDKKRLVFWINIYNAYIMDILKDHPEKYEDRGKFFKEKQMTIAGKEVSFDDIEHGVIRSSTVKLSLGFFRKWFVSKWERKLRTDNIDYRVHFALNCGAKSCPPVAIYKEEDFNQNLNRIASAYLHDKSEYIETENKVITTPLMSWFRGDFGGLNGVKSILKKEGIIPNENVNLSFGDYDWTIFLFNFTE